MSFYREQVLPRLVDRACGTSGLRRWRAEVTEGLTGRVIEIGFGSGLNVDHYPPDVELIFAVEPAAVARRLSNKRIARSVVPVTHIGLDGQAIPLDDDTCDSALSTFTLCTIPDVQRALAELRRVMRPKARFHFLEHGLAPDPARRRLATPTRTVAAAPGRRLSSHARAGDVGERGRLHDRARGAAICQGAEALELVQRRGCHKARIGANRPEGIRRTRRHVRRSGGGRPLAPRWNTERNDANPSDLGIGS